MGFTPNPTTRGAGGPPPKSPTLGSLSGQGFSKGARASNGAEQASSIPSLPSGSPSKADESTPTAPLNTPSSHPPDQVEAPKEPETLFATLRDLFQLMATSQASSASGTQAVDTPGSKAGPLPTTPTGRNAPSRPASAQAGRGATGAITGPSPGSTSGTTAPGLSGPGGLNKAGAGAGAGAGAVDATAVRKFLTALRRENILFDSTMHQDAHELLNFVLNRVGEDLVAQRRKEQKEEQAAARRREENAKQLRSVPNAPLRDAQDVNPDEIEQAAQVTNGGSENGTPNAPAGETKTVDVRDVGEGGSTCVHRLFEGTLTNETRCLTCETVSSALDPFKPVRCGAAPIVVARLIPLLFAILLDLGRSPPEMNPSWISRSTSNRTRRSRPACANSARARCSAQETNSFAILAPVCKRLRSGESAVAKFDFVRGGNSVSRC